MTAGFSPPQSLGRAILNFMKPITIYEAPDGSRFDTQPQCLRYEEMLLAIKRVELSLGGTPPDSNGGTFVQHTRDQIAEFDREFEKIIRNYFSNEQADSYRRQPTGFVWRVLSDSNTPFNTAICKAGYRRQAIDSRLREWGQIYYANNPNPAAIAA